MLLVFQHVYADDNINYGNLPPDSTRIDPINDCITHHNKGVVFLESGYPLHAIDEFKIALMLNPNSSMSATVYNNLGRAYEMVRKYDLAIISYEHAIKVNPDFSLYYRNLINAYIAKKALKKAQSDYEKIVKINPMDAQAFFILGLIYMERGNKPEAIKAFKKYVSLEPNRELAFAAKKYIKKLEGSKK